MNRLQKLVLVVSVVASASALAGGNPQAGKEKSTVCAGCHGADGNSTVGANPRLAGQYETYLYHALLQYKTGERQDMLMRNMVANLSKQDLKDLAAWFASQKAGGLEVLPKD
jgi:cytochrome c553